MAGKGTFVIRSGGIGVVFLAGLSLFFLSGFFFNLHQGRGDNSLPVYFLAMAILGGFPAFFFYVLASLKITVDAEKMTVRSLFRSLLPATWSVPLADIDWVILQTVGQIRNRPDLMKLPYVRDVVDMYESLEVSSEGISVPMAPAVQFTPLIIVKANDPYESRVIVTKLLSRKGAQALFAALRRHGVQVTGDERF